jgi:hypothetical protein
LRSSVLEGIFPCGFQTLLVLGFDSADLSDSEFTGTAKDLCEHSQLTESPVVLKA